MGCVPDEVSDEVKEKVGQDEVAHAKMALTSGRRPIQEHYETIKRVLESEGRRYDRADAYRQPGRYVIARRQLI